VAPRRLTILAAVVAGVVVAAAAVILLGRDAPGTPEQAPVTPIRGRAQLLPASVEFGDQLNAQVAVIVDPAKIDPHRVRVSESFAPLTVLGPTRTRIVAEGSMDAVALSTPIACLDQACVSTTGVRSVTLPAVRVTVTEGRTAPLTLHWPVLSVQGRVAKSALASAATALHADASPPAVSYRISPSTLAWLLIAAAGLLAGAAIALTAREIQRVLAARRRTSEDEVTRALALVRDAERRPAPDRRRALDLLARVLRGDRTAAEVRDLAWSEPEPGSGDLSALVERLEIGGDGSK
jgi:hypothetical protein